MKKITFYFPFFLGLFILSTQAKAGLCYGGDPSNPTSCVAGQYECSSNSDCFSTGCTVCMGALYLTQGKVHFSTCPLQDARDSCLSISHCDWNENAQCVDLRQE